MSTQPNSQQTSQQEPTAPQSIGDAMPTTYSYDQSVLPDPTFDWNFAFDMDAFIDYDVFQRNDVPAVNTNITPAQENSVAAAATDGLSSELPFQGFGDAPAATFTGETFQPTLGSGSNATTAPAALNNAAAATATDGLFNTITDLTSAFQDFTNGPASAFISADAPALETVYPAQPTHDMQQEQSIVEANNANVNVNLSDFDFANNTSADPLVTENLAVMPTVWANDHGAAPQPAQNPARAQGLLEQPLQTTLQQVQLRYDNITTERIPELIQICRELDTQTKALQQLYLGRKTEFAHTLRQLGEMQRDQCTLASTLQHHGVALRPAPFDFQDMTNLPPPDYNLLNQCRMRRGTTTLFPPMRNNGQTQSIQDHGDRSNFNISKANAVNTLYQTANYVQMAPRRTRKTATPPTQHTNGMHSLDGLGLFGRDQGMNGIQSGQNNSVWSAQRHQHRMQEQMQTAPVANMINPNYTRLQQHPTAMSANQMGNMGQMPHLASPMQPLSPAAAGPGHHRRGSGMNGMTRLAAQGGGRLGGPIDATSPVDLTPQAGGINLWLNSVEAADVQQHVALPQDVNMPQQSTPLASEPMARNDSGVAGIPTPQQASTLSPSANAPLRSGTPSPPGNTSLPSGTQSQSHLSTPQKRTHSDISGGESATTTPKSASSSKRRKQSVAGAQQTRPRPASPSPQNAFQQQARRAHNSQLSPAQLQNLRNSLNQNTTQAGSPSQANSGPSNSKQNSSTNSMAVAQRFANVLRGAANMTPKAPPQPATVPKHDIAALITAENQRMDQVHAATAASARPIPVDGMVPASSIPGSAARDC